MLCREGKISLSCFISGIITTVPAIILVQSLSSIGLDSFRNTLLCFSGPIVTYLIFCVIAYLVTTHDDFAVSLVIPDHTPLIKTTYYYQLIFIFYSLFIDNQKSNDTRSMFRYIDHCHDLRSIAMETFRCIFPFYVNISLYGIFNDCMDKSTNTLHRYIHVESFGSVHHCCNDKLDRVFA